MVIEETREKAIDVLKKNAHKEGFSATTEKVSNYYSVWTRDHCICAIASCLEGDPLLMKVAKRGILFLLRKQTTFGQVPSYFEIENRRVVYGGLGSITSIDSNMWLIIAAAKYYEVTADTKFISEKNMRRYWQIYKHLNSLDINDSGLIIIPKAGDWADIFNRTYHVLYDECLYYQTLKDLMYLMREAMEKTDSEDLKERYKKRITWIKKRRIRVKKRINEVFWFTKENVTEIKEAYMIFDSIPEREYGYYQSHLMPFKHHWQNRFESFGNIIAILSGVADKKKRKKIISHVTHEKINEPVPMRALFPPVYKHEKGWESIYRYKEKSHTYHNGGIWPMIAGFYIRALMHSNKKRQAKRELHTFAEFLKKEAWKFHEYYHGKNLRAMGNSEQAWSAAGFLIAYHADKRMFVT